MSYGGTASASGIVQESVFGSIESRIRSIQDSLLKGTEILRQIADSVHGSEPSEINKQGPVPVPAGSRAKVTCALDDLELVATRLHDQIRRFSNLA